MTAAEDIGSFDALVDDEDRGIKILVCHPFLLQHLNGARSYGWLNLSGERCNLRERGGFFPQVARRLFCSWQSRGF